MLKMGQMTCEYRNFLLPQYLHHQVDISLTKWKQMNASLVDSLLTTLPSVRPHSNRKGGRFQRMMSGGDTRGTSQGPPACGPWDWDFKGHSVLSVSHRSLPEGSRSGREQTEHQVETSDPTETLSSGSN